MSLEDMTSDMILDEVQDALRRELEKKPLGHPVYHSGHIVSAIALGERIAEERIIKLLEGKRFLCSDKECCWLATEYACDCKEVIALIKGKK